MTTSTIAPPSAPDPSGQSLRDAILDRLWTVHNFTPLTEDDQIMLRILHGSIERSIDRIVDQFPSR